MIVKEKHVLKALGVRKPSLSRLRDANDMGNVSVHVKICQEGSAMQPVVVQTRGVGERRDLHVVHDVIDALFRLVLHGIQKWCWSIRQLVEILWISMLFCLWVTNNRLCSAALGV